MEFNLNRALFQARKVSDLAADLRTYRNSLIRLKGSLDQHWKGAEMVHMDQAIATMANELLNVANQLETLENDITVSAIEINREIAESKALAEKAAAEAKTTPMK